MYHASKYVLSKADKKSALLLDSKKINEEPEVQEEHHLSLNPHASNCVMTMLAKRVSFLPESICLSVCLYIRAKMLKHANRN